MSYLDPTISGPIRPIDPRAQALCLSGGGYRGLYTARILEHLQTLTTSHLHTHFRFIAGTSIGAIIGGALAAGVKPQRIREEIEAIGPQLFARRRFHTVRRLWAAPYSQNLLSETLTKLFSEAKVGELLEKPVAATKLPLIVVATSASVHEPRIYGGMNIPFESHPTITLREALLASSAAPTYFPAQIAANETLLDGGLVANAPDAIALGLLQRRFGVQLPHCHVLSIGTCAPVLKPQPPRPNTSGKVGWILKNRTIVDVTLDSQERLTIQIMNQLLKDQFMRIDSTATGEDAKQVSTLDHATPEATQILKKLADEKWQTLGENPQLRAYFR